MNSIAVAIEEWRYWSRSKLALTVIVLFVVIAASVSTLNMIRIQTNLNELEHHQTESEDAFVSQPDRNPHRMVHYGHYVFRTPVPLASFDPGLNPLTGQAMFLEGHRQNSATFTNASANGSAGLAWLTPALTYQILLPLLIILLGHSAVIRERESGVLATLLAQGINGRTFVLGKLIALLSFVLVMLTPLLVNASFSLFDGESFVTIIILSLAYLTYLSIWVGLTILASSILRTRAAVITSMAALWLVLTLMLPSLAVNIASMNAPLVGKIESELAMLNEQKDLSDGHSVQASEVEKLQADLFKKYDTDKLEELPVNIRGLLAQEAERTLTKAMNEYAAKRMASEAAQARLLAQQGWLTPVLAISVASRTMAGTDLHHYHKFLLQAEALRYEFVQGINQVHAEQLSYLDDINRNRDEASYNRSRVSAENWQLLGEFEFAAESATTRLSNASASLVMLLVWMTVLIAAIMRVSGRLQP